MRMVVETPENQKERLIQRLFRAYWVENLDVSDKRLLLGLAKEAGVTVFGSDEAVFERQPAKDGLRKNTQEGPTAFIISLHMDLPSMDLNGGFNWEILNFGILDFRGSSPRWLYFWGRNDMLSTSLQSEPIFMWTFGGGSCFDLL